MSYTEYLRTKMAAEQKVINIRNPTDASMATSKLKMISSQIFRQDGTNVGSMIVGTDRPTPNHSATSYVKASGKTADCSSYTIYRGHIGIGNDAAYRTGYKKTLPCVNPLVSPPTPGDWTYPNASNFTNNKTSCPKERGDTISDIKFVDNTISLSATHPRMVAVDGCCDHKIEDPNHIHSSGIKIDVDNQRYAIGKSFFMSNPPVPEGPNVSFNKVGGYLGPRSIYVENKHGFVGRLIEVPTAPGGQGQQIAHLKINTPQMQ